MPFFYKTPADLSELESFVMRVASEIALRAMGGGSPGYLEEMMAEVIVEMDAARVRLTSEGRQGDLKAFRKHLLHLGSFMDNAPYNHVFLPLLEAHL